ncbi:hypothetical protein [Kordia sp.]|uniref:hypothetical protein n=1 Tax=Kordia sp. TaxID=1965332 RepID=UPI003D2D128C
MKKKEFLSKLKFQKTTVVSFSIIRTLKGGTLQNTDTQIVSVDGFMCLTTVCIPNPTLDNACLSQDPTECSRPTNSKTTGTAFCYGDLPTKVDCGLTIKLC